MKIILISIGTRGDMEPFLAIGEILKEKGHRVICAFPEQFGNLAQDSNLEFASLETEYIEMLESDVGKAAMGGSGSLKKFLALIRLAKIGTTINKDLVNKQYKLIKSENPDRIVYNGKAICPVIWGLNNREKNILICSIPYMHYVRGHTHVAFNSNFGAFFNKLTFSLAHFGIVTTVMITKRWLKITQELTRKQIQARNYRLRRQIDYKVANVIRILDSMEQAQLSDEQKMVLEKAKEVVIAIQEPVDKVANYIEFKALDLVKMVEKITNNLKPQLKYRGINWSRYAPLKEEVIINAENIAIKDGIFCFYNQGNKYHFCYKPAEDWGIKVEEIK